MEKPDRSTNIILGGMTLLFGLGGLILLVIGCLHWISGEQTRRWNTVPGQVLESQMVEVEGSTGLYAVSILYRYQVDGVPYQGNRITLSDSSSSRLGEQYHLAEKYSSDSTVKVYFDPKAPDSAILEPGPAGFIWIFFLIGGGFLLPGMILGYFWIRLIRAQSMATRPGKTQHKPK